MPIYVPAVSTSDIITLQDAKDQLNITSSTSDPELQFFVSAASASVSQRLGSVAGSPVRDETYDGGSPTIMLRSTPVASVSSVTESFGSSIVYTLTNQPLGTGFDAYGYTVDLVSGLLTRRASGVAVPFAYGIRNVHVVYVAGYSTVPADIQQALRLLVQHMWETQRGSSRRPGQNTADEYDPRGSYAWPRRVEELLAPYYSQGIA